MLEMIISLAIIAVIFAVTLPQFRNMENSWASKQATAEAIQNGRILTSYLKQNLAKAAQITAVSDPCDTTGYIEFEGNDGNTYRYEIGADNIVEFGPVGSLVDLAGPVSQLQFTCYDVQDLDTPTTTPEDIRFVRVTVTLTNTGPGQDKTFTTAAYLRTNKGSGSLVGHWKFDEKAGITAEDSSRHSNDGTLENMSGAQWTAGPVNGALKFDGYNDYVDCGNDTELQLTDALSITAWIKADDWTYGRYVNAIARKGNTTPVNYQLCIADQKVMLGLDDMDKNDGVRGNTLLRTGRWYHVAGAWDGDTVRIYVDGVLDNNPPDTRTGTIWIDTRPLYLGGRPGEDYFDGIIDNVRIYNRALDPCEIAELAGTRAGLVGYWKFDETNGSTAADSSGNGIDAIVSGGTWDAGGQIDGALDFDGNDDYVNTTIPSNEVTNLTFTLWFQSDDAGSIGDDEVAQRFITQQRTGTTDNRFALGINNNKLTVYWYDGQSRVREGITILSPGRWYHAALTYNGSEIRMYLDGTKEKSFNESGIFAPSSDVIEIGRKSGDGGSRHFDGLLDEVRIYRRALNDTEIQAIYNQNEYCCNLAEEILP
jgi:type II secretory pathway pseudopilin PulG